MANLRCFQPVFASAILLVIGMLACSPQNKQPENPNRSACVAGWTFAKKFVPDALKSPSSAEFDLDNVNAVKMKEEDGAVWWLVAGEVQASNAFGVKLRNKWEVLVIHVDGNYMPGVVSLEGQTVFKLGGH